MKRKAKKSSPRRKAVKKRAKLRELTEDEAALPMPEIRIQNIVSTFYLGMSAIDLCALATQLDFIDYNPSKFAAATVRIAEPRTTALIFASGNAVCTGAKNVLESRFAVRKYVHLLQSHGIRASMCKFKIQNIVATAHVCSPLMLREFSHDYGAYCSYEPELFPGLVFRTVSPKVVFLVFRSGKIVSTGAKSIECIHTVFTAFYHGILKNYIDTTNDNGNSATYRREYRDGLKNADAYGH
jgi:transcription initiation factor TFIID TATA-box-binding protein